MTVSGSTIKLGDLVGKLDMLELACNRCDRRGRLRLADLIAIHGAGRSRSAPIGTPANDQLSQ
jgi:hypothetical protein